MMRAFATVSAIAIAACFVAITWDRAYPHDSWSDGSPIPAWVKSACCGPSDVHHLTADQVHVVTGGYTVDGFNPVCQGYESQQASWVCTPVIPAEHILPSQDGDFWIFYVDHHNGTTGPAYCFFAPMDL